MRRTEKLMGEWSFQMPDRAQEKVTLPHTWNAIDGQDGGNDYLRLSCTYEKSFKRPDFAPEKEECWIEFKGVNASATVILNGSRLVSHDGGYSTFRANMTEYLLDDNTLTVTVDNSANDRVYPQKADFTFYGGIYRDVNVVIVDKNHFSLDHYGGSGVMITPKKDGTAWNISTRAWTVGDGEVHWTLYDQEGNEMVQAAGHEAVLRVEKPHLWEGALDPYLYTVKAGIVSDGELTDSLDTRVGLRTFSVDPGKGFFLNGKPYPLHGVSRHQDRKGIGNAITKEMHDEDMALIKEMGANTIRLAHYQHDDYFYDLCDEAGMVIWAEIPYISEHMNNGRENTISQMKELIVQNYNHPSIVCWGVSNEITISTRDKADMLDNHKVLNDLCHRMDPTRLTTLACYAMCSPFHPVAHITDLVSWNLYLGWYVPGLFLNDLWMGFFHMRYPDRPLGFSEYGAEGMPNLHSARPKRGDHTEEYQAIYHEYMLECFKRHPWLWSTHVWNMFDFAADARNQGGEPGMNHKGLVTFDRKTKKDSFYLYKAYWSDEPFVHICSKRFVNRIGNVLEIKVYSNQPSVTLEVGGKKITKTGDHIFKYKLHFEKDTRIRVTAGGSSDEAEFKKVSRADASYKLKKDKAKSANWV